MPPKNTAIGVLAQAIVNLENNPLPMSISGIGHTFLQYIAPEVGFATRVILANINVSSSTNTLR